MQSSTTDRAGPEQAMRCPIRLPLCLSWRSYHEDQLFSGCADQTATGESGEDQES